MPLTFTSEQEELRTVVRKFLATHADETQVRAQMETPSGYDTGTWKLMADQLGVQSIAIPEEYGGAGFGFGELSVVLEEAGRALLCAPLFSTVVLGATTLLESGDVGAAAAYLPGIAEGRTIATLALIEEGGRWSEDGIHVRAVRDGEDFRISGTKPFVLDGADADLIIVAARTDSGVSLFTVDAGDSGVEATALPTLDQTRRLASLTFSNAPAKLLGIEGQGWEVLERVLEIAAAGLGLRAGGRRCPRSRVDGRLRQGEGTVRQADRFVPGRQAQAGRHARRARVRSLGCVLRGLRSGVALLRPAACGVDREDLLLDGLLPHRRREHPAARRDRVHLGAPGTPVLQAGQGIGDPARVAGVPPGAHRSAPDRSHGRKPLP